MSRNGSGVYTLNTSGQPVVAGTTITATAFNSAMSDIATALTQSIAYDGQTTTTGLIPFAFGLKTDILSPYTALGPVSLTAGQLQFPASQNASSDPNTLDDYEEGTWTPTDQSGATLTFSNVSATYTKIGRLVFAQCYLTYPVTANTSQAVIGGLPFTVANANYARQGFASLRGASAVAGVYCIPNGTTFAPCTSTGAAVQNDSMSGGNHSFTLIYPAA